MAFKGFIRSDCPTASDDTVGGVVTKGQPLQIFNFLNQLTDLTANPSLCGTKDATLSWTRNVSTDWINCCGENIFNGDFVEGLWGSTPKKIESTQYFQRYQTNENENIMAGTGNLVTAPSSTNKFQLAASSHHAKGTTSSVFVGMWLHSYTTYKNYQVVAVNTTSPKAHIITVRSDDGSNVVIKANDKFMRMPAVAVGGVACRVGSSTMNSNFLTKGVNKLRLKNKWDMNLDVDKPYADLMKFAPFLDKKGNASWSALPIAKQRCMQEVSQAVALFVLLGRKLSNPDILVDDWNGGESILEAISNAGKVYDYNPTEGYSLETDFETKLLIEDANKRTNKWKMYSAKPFHLRMIGRINKDAQGRSATLPYDYASMSRNGNDMGVINKHGFTEYNYGEDKIERVSLGEFSTSNGLGNGKYPYLGILMANEGLKDSRGNSIPPIEFFHSKNQSGEWASMEEVDRDNRFINGCETLEGDITKSVMWMVHCPNRHWLLNPVNC